MDSHKNSRKLISNNTTQWLGLEVNRSNVKVEIRKDKCSCRGTHITLGLQKCLCCVCENSTWIVFAHSLCRVRFWYIYIIYYYIVMPSVYWHLIRCWERKPANLGKHKKWLLESYHQVTSCLYLCCSVCVCVFVCICCFYCQWSAFTCDLVVTAWILVKYCAYLRFYSQHSRVTCKKW